MTTKHTAGPWKVAEPRKSYLNGEMMYRVEGPEIVGDYEDWGYTESDARLMAAAPDLLSALNAMLTHMGMDEDEWNKPTFDQARAAVIKATGGQA